MSRQIHEYFDTKSTNWSVLGFLEECDEEPFQKKIDKYLKDLEIIADYEQGKRQEQANLLLSRYREDHQPDFKVARKWEKERSRKQIHYHRPTITDISGNMTGNIGTIIGGSFVVGSKRKQEESDDDFQPPRTPSTKRKKQLSLPKKNKEPVKSRAKTTNKNVEDEDDDSFISPSSSSREDVKTNSPIYDRSSTPTRRIYSTADLLNRHEGQNSLDIDISKIEILTSLRTKSHLENYNILCLFDVEFPYTKKLFETLSTDQVGMLKSKWAQAKETELIEDSWKACSLKILVDKYSKVIEENTNEDTLYLDLNALIAAFMKPPCDGYQHQINYEFLWCQTFYIQMALQMLRKHGSLQDSSTSEYQYRDEIVNPLLSSIFHDVEHAFWIKTGEIENDTRKRQRNSSKEESERERIGDKHDGILYLDIHGTKVGVGYIEVVGNAFTTNRSDKNDDLEKLLKATMISIWYQNAHKESNTATLKLQSFAILVFGREFHFLCMRLIENMYIIDEYDAFVLPDSSLCFSQIENIVKVVKKFKIRIRNYYRELIQNPRRVTQLSNQGLPDASPSKTSKLKNK